jgi:hypothetical protein
MSRLVVRWLPRARVLHPWPDERFEARTQGRSPVRYEGLAKRLAKPDSVGPPGRPLGARGAPTLGRRRHDYPQHRHRCRRRHRRHRLDNPARLMPRTRRSRNEMRGFARLPLGGERYGSRPCERTREPGEDRQVGVQPHSIQTPRGGASAQSFLRRPNSRSTAARRPQRAAQRGVWRGISGCRRSALIHREAGLHSPVRQRHLRALRP